MIQHFWTDIAFITLNFAAFWIALAVILPRAGFPIALLLLPIGAAAADIIENIAVRSFLHGNPTESMIALARFATIAKLGCFAVMVVTIVAGAVSWIVKSRAPVEVGA